MKAYLLNSRDRNQWIVDDLEKYGFTVRVTDDLGSLNSYEVYNADCIFAPLLYKDECILPILRNLADSLPHVNIFVFHNKTDLCKARHCLQDETRFILIDIDSKQSLASIISDAQIMEDFKKKISESGLYNAPVSDVNKKALNFILFRFNEINGNDVYRFVNPPLSETVFNRKFESDCGITPNRLIRSLRMEYAAYLSRKTGLFLGQVSRICGFGNYKRFSELFKSYHNVSFRDYRRMNRH